MDDKDHPAYTYERMEEQHLIEFTNTIEEQLEWVFDDLPEDPEVAYEFVVRYYGKELRERYDNLLKCIESIPESCENCPLAFHGHFDHVTHFSMSWCPVLLRNRFRYSDGYGCLVTKERFLKLLLVLI